MAKTKVTAVITKQDRLAEDIYGVRIKAPQIAGEAVPGQFLSLYSKDGSKMLPGPISLCGVDREKRKLRLAYRIAGAGTREFSCLKEGDIIDVLEPLGNGSPLKPGERTFLIEGSIGIPPLLELAKVPQAEQESGRENGTDNGRGIVRSVLGYRDSRMFLKEESEAYGLVYMATEDGSTRTEGNVLDAIREQGLRADVIYAYGPIPMLRVLETCAAEQGVECWLSLEEKMACDIGTYLACMRQSKGTDRHPQVHNKCIRKDGPVFLTGEIEL